jgi:predicted branched-subunit amino acid permease
MTAPTTNGRREPLRRAEVLAGVRRGLGPAAATGVFGVGYGAMAVSAGWGTAAPATFSALAFSGTAQSMLLVTSAAGLVPAVAAAVLVNVRHVVMGIALNDALHGSRWARALQVQALVDPSFAIAHRGGGRFDRALLVGATVPQWFAWVGGTVIGLVLAPTPDVVAAYGLDVALPAFFLLLAVDEMRRSGPAVLAAVAGAVLTGAALLVLPASAALLVALTGALVGLAGRGQADGS